MDISYISSHMVNLIHAPICIYVESEAMLLRPGQDKQNRKLNQKEENLLREKFDFEISDKPMMGILDNTVQYATIQIEDGKWILIGPVQISPSTEEQFKQVKYKYRNLNSLGFDIQRCQMRELLSGILLLYHAVTGATMDASQLWKFNQHRFPSIAKMQARLSENIFDRQEKQKSHNPYSQELRELESIKNGDVEALNHSISETYEGEIGILAKEPLRHHKNVAIGNITMASRAAVKGGLNAELAFSMADSFIQQLEEIENITEVEVFKRTAQRIYAQTVHEQTHSSMANNNPLVEGVKNYIFSHLHDNIRIEDIAKSLHVSSDYLSHLFSKSEQVTIKRYILQEKINRSKNLLCYSDYSLQEIAFYLGFSTQSYFTKIFKDIVGMTPGEYRNQLND